MLRRSRVARRWGLSPLYFLLFTSLVVYAYAASAAYAYSEYGIIFEDPLSSSGKKLLKLLEAVPVSFQEVEKEYLMVYTDPLKKESFSLLSKMLPDMDAAYGTRLHSLVKESLAAGKRVEADKSLDPAKRRQQGEAQVKVIRESIYQAFYLLLKRKFASMQENLENEKGVEILSLVKVVYNNIWAPLAWKAGIQHDTQARKAFKDLERSFGRPGGYFGVGRKSGEKKKFQEARQVFFQTLRSVGEFHHLNLPAGDEP